MDERGRGLLVSDAAPPPSKLEVRSLPADVRDALINRGHRYDDEITTAEAFDEFCSWHGLIGWGPHLRATMASLVELEGR